LLIPAEIFWSVTLYDAENSSGLANGNLSRRLARATNRGRMPMAARTFTSAPQAPAGNARMRPVLSLVRKLTLSPSHVTSADAEAVFAAGWDDYALHDAAAICGLFNLMNRLVDGLGIETDAVHTQFVAQRLATISYAGFLPVLPEAK
jgi:hypothetical protein